MVRMRRNGAVPAVMTVSGRFPAVQWQWLLFVLTVFLLLPSSVPAYDYPLDNPYAATIVGTPTDLQVELPKKIRDKELKLAPLAGRELPGLFWYQQAFRYSLAYQKHKAPLIFVIAGTGANYKSPKMQTLKKAFFQAGFHVVCLTSPTYANFIVTASGSGMPGNIRDDSADLYQVMSRIWQDIGEQVEVSEFFLTGYSLGGAQAAFISQLDEEQKRFNFNKILMINPPLSLFSSVGILDAMLEENIPGGADNFNNFFNKTMAEFSAVYKESDWLIFNNDFLYRVYQRGNSSDANMMALIGISFRIAAADMVFTADVMNNAGYILPKNLELSSTDSTTDYAKVAFRTSFLDYFDELFLPFFQRREPDLSRQALIDRQSLASIEEYLATTEKIGMLHNADDVILGPGELDYLAWILGPRAKIYPAGGHCGNMEHRQNVKDMVEFFLP